MLTRFHACLLAKPLGSSRHGYTFHMFNIDEIPELLTELARPTSKSSSFQGISLAAIEQSIRKMY